MTNIENKSPFIIDKLNLVSTWVFNLPKNTECTICRCSLNGPSLYHQEKGKDSYVVSGMCQHSFHDECIKPWVQKNKFCPICTQKWEFLQSRQTEIVEKPKSKVNTKINFLKDEDVESLNKNQSEVIIEASKLLEELKESLMKDYSQANYNILKPGENIDDVEEAIDIVFDSILDVEKKYINIIKKKEK